MQACTNSFTPEAKFPVLISRQEKYYDSWIFIPQCPQIPDKLVSMLKPFWRVSTITTKILIKSILLGIISIESTVPVGFDLKDRAICITFHTQQLLDIRTIIKAILLSADRSIYYIPLDVNFRLYVSGSVLLEFDKAWMYCKLLKKLIEEKLQIETEIT